MSGPGDLRPAAIRLDAVGGAAGDMFAAAMLDCFPDLRERVLADCRAVLPVEAGVPFLREGMSAGLRVLRFGLETSDHEHHHHGHHHDHHHTDYRSLTSRIEAATLSPGTGKEALAVLRIIAEAEAKMHSIPVDEVHFHEIADWDSLMDVVAAGSIAAALAPCRWTVSSLPLGSGTVRTAHGILPVPAPATAEILKGFAWHDDGVAGERVTPTGAAILRHLCDPTESGRPQGHLLAVGMGAGTRDLPGMPNMLRATAFASAGAGEQKAVAIISFDVDDMTGEEIATACEKLRVITGVIDLITLAVSGKKGRPVCRFELLARPDTVEAVAEACFAQTSTIGLRWRIEQRLVLPREQSYIDGIGIKTVTRPGGSVTAKAESDDLVTGSTLAERRATALRAVRGDGDD